MAFDRLDLAIIDAEIGELVIQQRVKLVHRLAINAPVMVSAEQVHFSSLFRFRQVGLGDRVGSVGSDCFPCDEVDVVVGNTEVGQFTVRQAAISETVSR